MRTVIFGVRSIEEITADILRSAELGGDATPRISFPSTESLWSVLNPRRLALLKVMVGQGPLSMREVARRAQRDVKAVHGDLTLLLEAGVIYRAETGVLFPYDRIHVDYVLEAAA